MKSKHILGVFIVLLIGFTCQIIHPILAQQNYFGVMIDPALIYLPVSTGETYTETIKLTNDFQHQNPVKYYPSVSLFRQSDDSGNAEFYSDEALPDYADASSWISFSEDSYEINYGDTVESTYTITIPSNATPGGHYIALIYSDQKQATQESDENPDKTVQLSSAITSLMFITVPGDVTENGELLEFKTSKFLYEAPPIDFQIRYKNSGNVHTSIGGNIFVYKNNIQDSVEQLTVNPDAGLTLPGNTRQYEESFNNGALYIDDGKFKLNRDLLPNIYFGEYTATLKLKHTVNNERITEDHNVTFWIIPWRLITAAFAIILVIVMFSKIIKPKETPIIKVANTDES